MPQLDDAQARTSGVDEAGRGCLAGPVVAAAVILAPFTRLPGLNDSKQLSVTDRERLEPLIKIKAVAWSVGVVWPRDIERLNIHHASLEAMARAVTRLKVMPLQLVVDGKHVLPGLRGVRQQAKPGADATVRCVSAASVIAKTFRDRIMTKLDARYPGYGLAGHKGYATTEHRVAIQRLGPCRMHRMTFRGVRSDEADPEQGCLFGGP